MPRISPSYPGWFDFTFLTDTHIQPELDAGHGCETCFYKIAGIKSDFAIMGGDPVCDALKLDNTRSKLLFDLYQKTEQSLQMKLYNTIGNHDLFGINAKSSVSTSAPNYAKNLYEAVSAGTPYYFFDHKGYHFFSGLGPTYARPQVGGGGPMKRNCPWLAEDLKQLGPDLPAIGITHVPFVTAFAS